MINVKRAARMTFRQGTALALPSIPAPRFGALAPGVRDRALKRITFLAVLVSFAFVPLWAAQLGYSEQAKQIGLHLKCMCRGCEMSAGGCAHPGGAFSGPCDTAKAMLKEVDQHLAKGESEQQIIQAFVAEYGTIVYMEPPKKGFGLVAWLMPIVYFLVGLALAVLVVRKWRDRQRATAPPAPNVHSEALDRARAQAARETED
jgi:cytochrome c-type biogenesis protein CcmH/NrfF